MHSYELYALVASCTVLTGIYAYWHATRFWEGLPPLLDAFTSMAGFLLTLGAFVAGGRIGGLWGHPHAGHVAAITIALIAVRTTRTRLGREQERFRSARARKVNDSDS